MDCVADPQPRGRGHRSEKHPAPLRPVDREPHGTIVDQGERRPFRTIPAIESQDDARGVSDAQERIPGALEAALVVDLDSGG